METVVLSTPGNGNSIDGKVWPTFEKSLSQVQNILDQNRLLISEINQNHESKTPENLTRNVALIRELNSNIARVVELYANLSTEFVKSMETSSEGESTETQKVETARTKSPLSGQKRIRST